jgi:hypothetical protein
VPVCHQLVGTANRLSANEALTYFQTIQIIKDFGAREFDALHKHMATRKLVSRALRWMRRRKLIVGSPVTYARLLLLYAKICGGRRVHWERCLACAAEPYVAFLPKSRQPY